MTATVRIVRVADVPAQPWKNGGGVTRELLTWPTADGLPSKAMPTDWQLRISVANIDRDGPFSPFPGVQRWFAVLQGAGVSLSFSELTIDIRQGQEAHSFSGLDAPGCQLIDGPTVDLNLMARSGSGCMQRWVHSAPSFQAIGQAGIFSVSGGSLVSQDAVITTLPAMSLAWCEAADHSTWQFTPTDKQQPAYWISFKPAESHPA